MSDQAFDGADHHREHGREAGILTSATGWLGALLSVALVAGLGVWSYQLTMRDVNDVPVIRAMKGPLRITPDDPGGELAEHRGLAVNNVQAEGGVAPVAERVVLAPPPVDLSTEDVALAEIRPNPRIVEPVVDAAADLDLVPSHLTDVSALAEGDAERAAIDAAVAAAVNEASGGEIAKDQSSTIATLAKLPGVKRSPRPRARLKVAALAAGAAADPKVISDASALVTVDVDPAEVPDGARLVQLGAFDDIADAEKEWDYILDRHGDLVANHPRLIQQAESGGRRFYRLRMAGFESLNDSRRLCSALLARGTPCIPVTAH